MEKEVQRPIDFTAKLQVKRIRQAEIIGSEAPAPPSAHISEVGIMELQTFITVLREYPVLMAAYLERASDEELLEISRLPGTPSSSVLSEAQNEPLLGVVGFLSSILPSTDAPLQATADLNGKKNPMLGDLITVLPSLISTWSEIKPYAEISPQISSAWLAHVSRNLGAAQAREEQQGASSGWSYDKEDVETAFEQVVHERITVVAVPIIDNRVFSLTLAGPCHTTFVYSKAALDSADDLERDFVYYHQFAHYLLPNHLSGGEFDLRIEFQRGYTPHQLLGNVDYLRAEQEADDVASCMMYSEYIEHEQLSPLSAQAVRGALQNGASIELIRRLIKARVETRGRLVSVVPGTPLSLRSVQCIPVKLESLPDAGTLHLVQGYDRHVYVVIKSSDGSAWKQWACSRRVLDRLDQNPKKRLKRLPQKELDAYPELQPLLDPSQVDALRIARICWSCSPTDLAPADEQYSEAELQNLIGTLAESIVNRPEHALVGVSS